jgi:antitoxin component of RelBE/YafQ-DinJ toxin-antitoxin module
MAAMRSMKARVSEEAYDTLSAFMVREGFTLGAMIEAFAEAIRLEGGLPSEISRATLTERARTITAERRRRGNQD